MEALQYWMGELANRSESTRKKYKRYFSLFCEWIGKTADELVTERKEDLKEEDLKNQRRMETLLKGFIAHLKSSGLSVSTQQVAYAAVQSFFEMHYMPLRMRRGDYPSGESLGYRAATKNDILKLLDSSSIRVKAMILFLKDSGLRVSDLASLKYKDVAKGLEEEAEFIKLNLITQKNSISARTFIGPEAIEALKAYFQQRKEGTRRLSPEEISDNSPLFRTRSREIAPISRSGMSSTITFHAGKVGLDGQLSAHSFRKFFQTQLEAAGVHPNWIDQMIGHKLQGATNSYSKPTDQQLKEAYMKAYHSLRAYMVPATSKEMREQAEKLRAAEKEVTQLRKSVRAMEERTNRTEEMFKQVMSTVLGEEVKLRLRKVEEEGENKIHLTLGLPEEALKKLRSKAKRAQGKQKAKSKPHNENVVKVEKQDIDTIVDLIKKGYEKTFENKTYVVFRKPD